MTELIPYLLQAIGALLALLAMILSWFGARIHNRLDEIKECLHTSDREVREEIAKLHTRVGKIETRCVFKCNEKSDLSY